MEYFLAPLWQDFNKIYADVVNSSIIPPPHYSWRVPHTFFFTKRWGFSEFAWTQTFHEIYDIVETGADIYYLWRIWTEVKVYKNSTQIFSWTYVAWVNYKFYYINSVKWTKAESWTWASWVTVWSDVVIQDLTKSWTVNAYAWKYVYIYSATAWTWQIMKIDSNTATNLVVTQSWWKTPPTWASYHIFSDFWDTLSFVWPDYIYTIHTSADVIKVQSVPNVIDAIYFKWRNYIIDSAKHVYVWDQWFFAWYFNIDSLIWALDDVVNIIDFQDYVLLLWLNQIKVVQSENVVLTQTSGTSVVKAVFKIVWVTTAFWLFNQSSFVVYNQWLYVFTKFKQFLSVSITSVWVDKYFVDTKPQGIYIQKFLDTITTTDKVRVAINDQNIIFITNNWTISNIYIYDFIYLWWHRWTTVLIIGWYKNLKFFWTKIYEISSTTFLDSWWYEYDQNIKIIVWEENIFNMKRSLLTKFYISKNTSLNCDVVFTIEAWWKIDTYTKSLWDLWYLQFAAWLYWWTSNTLGSNILWYWMLANQKASLSNIIADICNIEIPTWFFYELLIIELKWEWTNKVEFGWMMSWYSLFEPQVTSYQNVI